MLFWCLCLSRLKVRLFNTVVAFIWYLAVMCLYMHTCILTCPGARTHIPHLWSYHCLAQILPFSFIQNLFLLAQSIRRERPTEAKGNHRVPLPRYARSCLDQLAFVTLLGLRAYGRFGLSSVYGASDASTEDYALGDLLLGRLLLFGVQWVMRPQWEIGLGTKSQAMPRIPDDDGHAWHVWHHEYKWVYRLTTALYVSAVLWRAYVANEMRFDNVSVLAAQLLQTAQENRAVAALGFDWAWGVVSLVVVSCI